MSRGKEQRKPKSKGKSADRVAVDAATEEPLVDAPGLVAKIGGKESKAKKSPKARKGGAKK